jgi:hypothetical protein
MCVVVTTLTCQGRSLEELDEMFEAKLWAWQFSRYETKGVGHAIAELEADKAGKDNLVLDVLGVHDDKVRELSRAIVTADSGRTCPNTSRTARCRWIHVRDLGMVALGASERSGGECDVDFDWLQVVLIEIEKNVCMYVVYSKMEFFL